MFVNSGMLFGMARAAQARADEAASGDRSPGNNDAIIAVILAAATIEGVANEIAELASFETLPGEVIPDSVIACARVLEEVENGRGTIKLKYQMAKIALSGEPYDTGANPYQDFAVLLDLRNSLMHLKLDRINSVRLNEVDIEYPPVIRRLQSRNILAECDANTAASWIHLVTTVAVARWACDTSAAMVHSLASCVPASELKRRVDVLYTWASPDANPT